MRALPNKTKLLTKAKHIRLLILDVDGILTSGNLFYNKQGAEYRSFHVHDGLGIQWLQHFKITVAVITAKKSAMVKKRAKDLGIKYIYQGQKNKQRAYEKLKSLLRLTNKEIAYMGDDLPDLPLLRSAGLAITVPNAPEIMRQFVDWISKHQGGEGAVREVCDLILKAQGHYQAMLQSYIGK